MQKPSGYDDAQVFTGEFETLEPGGYVCVIRQAVIDKTQTGKERINLLIDIAEGDKQGYFKRRFDDDVKFDGNAKWKGVYRQITEGSSTPFFKGLMTSIEASNPGYKWNWDEKSLAGKLVGVIFGREQYRALDGNLKWAVKPFGARSVDTIRKGVEPPKDKYLSDSSASGNNGYATNDDFAVVSAGAEDLPF